jgi:hypothetical protein
MTTLSRSDEILLVGLADGSLTGRRRARAEARAREIPGAAGLIERQRRVAHALRGEPLPVAAPQTVPVHATVGWRPWLAGAAILATILALLVSMLPHGDPSTVGRAAERAMLPATGPPPATDGVVLGAEVDGVKFPDWGSQFGWHETGLRSDVLDGRATKTVFYEHMGHRIAYTIVSGPALPVPERARTVKRNGLEIAVYHDPRHGGHDIAVFQRGGKTCVLAGHVEEASTLLKLAAWRGGGDIRS